MAKVLIIDDHDSVREGLELVLRQRGHRTLSAEEGQRGLDLFFDRGADLVITDLKMAGMDGLEVLAQVRKSVPDTDVLVITAYGTIEKAVEAMKLGAVDFITKPFSWEEFGAKVERLLRTRAERERLRRENATLRIENTYLRGESELLDPQYGEMVGESPAMRDVFRWVERVARSNSTVMIYGESGTGKELVARAIHARSGRRKRPFIRVNCGAIAESLLDSELFGHEKGAFTGAERRRRGRFELAHRGTLFLDEISTISTMTQVRLLRVLQERELERVGGEETISVDVRIIAATNVTPEELVARPTFREDLYYRLHVVPITLPPLRERGSDVALLARHFVAKLRERTCSRVESVSEEALAVLCSHDWPGNVRELENTIERALVMAEDSVLDAADLPPLGEENGGSLRAMGSGGRTASVDLARAVDEMEEKLIRRALEVAGGVKAEAARLLGLKSGALYYKLKKYGIEDRE